MSFTERALFAAIILMLLCPTPLILAPRKYLRYRWILLKWDWHYAYWTFRHETFDTRIGWWLNSQPHRRWLEKLGTFKWRRDSKLVERDIQDDEGNTATIGILRFSEKDIRKREQFLSQPASSEEKNTRQGRSRRGRGDNTIQIQRIRQFNFEYGLRKWPFVYPDEVWDEERNEYVPHHRAGQPVPINRKEIEDMGANISEQINDHLNEVNEPPAELPEVRDEEGNVIEEAIETPMAANSVAS